MGTVVHLQLRDDTAEAKTAAILGRIGDLYQQKLKAKDELPKVLAALALKGDTESALQAMIAWGTGTAQPYELLQRCRRTVRDGVGEAGITQ